MKITLKIFSKFRHQSGTVDLLYDIYIDNCKWPCNHIETFSSTPNHIQFTVTENVMKIMNISRLTTFSDIEDFKKWIGNKLINTKLKKYSLNNKEYVDIIN